MWNQGCERKNNEENEARQKGTVKRNIKKRKKKMMGMGMGMLGEIRNEYKRKEE